MTRVVATVLLLLGLAGCTSVRIIETDVLAQAAPLAGAALGAGATYHYERLPSQQADAARQQALEQLADTALGKIGMLRAADGQPADFSAQLSVQSGSWARDDEGMLFPVGQAGTRVSLGFGLGWPGRSVAMNLPITYLYRHELTLLLRELHGGQIAYEARAWHEGPWPDRARVLGTMLDAALQGFPNPPAGRRRMRTEVPR